MYWTNEAMHWCCSNADCIAEMANIWDGFAKTNVVMQNVAKEKELFYYCEELSK